MNVIAAVDRNWAIGKDGNQLVYLSEDLRRFKSGFRDKIRFSRPFKGRPPGKVARVFRPKITVCPVVRARNRLRSSDR